MMYENVYILTVNTLVKLWQLNQVISTLSAYEISLFGLHCNDGAHKTAV